MRALLAAGCLLLGGAAGAGQSAAGRLLGDWLHAEADGESRSRMTLRFREGGALTFRDTSSFGGKLELVRGSGTWKARSDTLSMVIATTERSADGTAWKSETPKGSQVVQVEFRDDSLLLRQGGKVRLRLQRIGSVPP